jgi:hypothetical protein
VHVLGELIGAGTISVAINQTVRLVHIVLATASSVGRSSSAVRNSASALATSPLRRLLRGTPYGVVGAGSLTG